MFADVKTEVRPGQHRADHRRRPEVILEIRARNEAFPTGDRAGEAATWNALGSVPAVRSGRVVFLFDDRIVIPGPRVVEGTTAIARALHPDAFK